MDSTVVYHKTDGQKNHPLFDDPRLAYPARRKRRRVLLIRLYEGVAKAGKAGVLKLPLPGWLAWLRVREATFRALMDLLTEYGAATWTEEGGTFAWAEGILPESESGARSLSAPDAGEGPVLAVVRTTEEAAHSPRQHFPSDDAQVQKLRRNGGNGHTPPTPSETPSPAPSAPLMESGKTDIYIDISPPDSIKESETDIYISAWQDVCKTLRAKTAGDREQWTEAELTEALFRLEGRTLQPAGRLAYFRSVLKSVREENRAGQGQMTLLTPVAGDAPERNQGAHSPTAPASAFRANKAPAKSPAAAPAAMAAKPARLSNAECDFYFCEASEAEQKTILSEARVTMRERNRAVYSQLVHCEAAGEVASRAVEEALTGYRNEIIRTKHTLVRKAG